MQLHIRGVHTDGIIDVISIILNKDRTLFFKDWSLIIAQLFLLVVASERLPPRMKPQSIKQQWLHPRRLPRTIALGNDF